MKNRILAAIATVILVVCIAVAVATPAFAGCACSNWYYSRFVIAYGTAKMNATNYDSANGTNQTYHLSQTSSWGDDGYYYQALYYFIDNTQLSGERYVTFSNRATDHGITAIWLKKTSPNGKTANSVVRTIPAF
jgi:hypothetical protein